MPIGYGVDMEAFDRITQKPDVMGGSPAYAEGA
jgi:uncharacterized protein (DUF433 family)